MTHHHRLLLALAPLFMLPAVSLAQVTSAVPPYINYQGSVVAADGTPVGGNNSPVNRSVVFRIWNHPTNSTLAELLYSETQVVTVTDGQFSVLIGEGVATTVGNYGVETTKKLADIAAAFAGKDCYLGVTVAAGATLATTDNEISPRQRIVSTGFAFRAKLAEGLAGGSDFAINPSFLPVGSAASNYGLGWYGTGRTFSNVAVDGPVLYGNSGGALGSSNGAGGTKNLALQWNANGQVGIGANSNLEAYNKLTLQGDDDSSHFSPAAQLVIRGNADTSKRLLVGFDTGADHGTVQSYKAASTPGDLILNQVGGNVGIGLLWPYSKLVVETGRQWDGIVLRNSNNAIGGLYGTSTTNDDGQFFLNSNANTKVLLSTNGNSYLNGGNVGMGTTTPGAKLDVVGPGFGFPATTGNVQSAGLAARFRTQNNAILDMGGNGGYGFWFQSTDMPNLGINYPLMLNPNGGNVGIGTLYPSAKLDVAGSGYGFPATTGNVQSAGLAARYRTLDNSALDMGGNGVYGYWLQSTNVTNYGTNYPLMLNPNGGNVGIGTTNPTAKLDVAGDIKSSNKSVPVAEENLRIIRGSVGAAGNIIAGSGFTVQKIDAGNMKINFTTPFSGRPTVTITGDNVNGWLHFLVNIGSGSFNTGMSDGGGRYDAMDNFEFIAIGPR